MNNNDLHIRTIISKKYNDFFDEYALNFRESGGPNIPPLFNRHDIINYHSQKWKIYGK